MRTKLIIGVLLVAGTAAAWVASTPPDYIVVAEPFAMGAPSAALTSVRAATDEIAGGARSATAVPGHDEVLLQEAEQRAFISGRDGWIWRLDLTSGVAEQYVRVPLVASGMRAVPGDSDRLLFCASHLYGYTPPKDDSVGVYELRISTRQIRSVALRVPREPALAPPPMGSEGTVIPLSRASVLAAAEMNAANSRPIAFCNDIDISRDGRRVYMSEPFAYPGAGMGESAFSEAVSLGRNGRLWMFDLARGTAQLVAQQYNFLDGILLDYGSEDATGVERSVVISETTKFRLLRLYIGGDRAGTDTVLQASLPGMPDGIDRDAQGRLYVALYKPRSGLITWVHAHPWVKPLLLRLPQRLVPVKQQTGYMVLDAAGERPLHFAWHDGSQVRDISKVNPGASRIYLASFDANNRGVFSVPYPAALLPRTVPQP